VVEHFTENFTERNVNPRWRVNGQGCEGIQVDLLVVEIKVI